MQRQHEWAHNRGYEFIETSAVNFNGAMIALNLSVGFKVIGPTPARRSLGSSCRSRSQNSVAKTMACSVAPVPHRETWWRPVAQIVATRSLSAFAITDTEVRLMVAAATAWLSGKAEGGTQRTGGERQVRGVVRTRKRGSGGCCSWCAD